MLPKKNLSEDIDIRKIMKAAKSYNSLKFNLLAPQSETEGPRRATLYESILSGGFFVFFGSRIPG